MFQGEISTDRPKLIAAWINGWMKCHDYVINIHIASHVTDKAVL